MSTYHWDAVSASIFSSIWLSFCFSLLLFWAVSCLLCHYPWHTLCRKNPLDEDAHKWSGLRAVLRKAQPQVRIYYTTITWPQHAPRKFMPDRSSRPSANRQQLISYFAILPFLATFLPVELCKLLPFCSKLSNIHSHECSSKFLELFQVRWDQD